ncbi:hypothetical protein FS842_011513 [Serendipita sp. 407]|nr:hypothetical protein FRC18_012340 [Serendipita sp. 400]KAG9049549.1 hypothetical protein FS842_011513 [Serendipita sp. 407]
MHSQVVATFIYFFLLGRSGLVGALPMQGANDPDNLSRPVRDVKSLYSSASMAEAAANAPKTAPTLPALKEGFPVVTPETLTKTCKAIHDYVLPVINGRIKEDNKMPDERFMTEDLIHKLRSVGGMTVGDHTQVEEGKTGTDVYIKVTFAEGEPEAPAPPATKKSSLSSGLSKLKITTPSKKAKEAKAAEAAQSTSADSKALTRHIVAIQAKSAKPIAQAHADSDEEPEVEDQPEKEDSKYPEDTDFEIDFTYKGKKSPDLQMNLLQAYVENLHNAHKDGEHDVAIVGGYLVYTHEGYMWIPVEEVIKMCHEIAEHEGIKCNKGNRKLNRRLTHYFLSQEKHWESSTSAPEPVVSTSRQGKASAQAQKSLKCFLEEIKNSPRFVPK